MSKAALLGSEVLLVVGFFSSSVARRFKGHHLHGPTVIRRALCGIRAGITYQYVLNQIVVEGRARCEARSRRASRVADAVTEDYVPGDGGCGAAARNRTGITQGAGLRVDGIHLIHARIFGQIQFNPRGTRGQIDCDRIGAALDRLRVIDAAAGASGRGQLGSHLGECVSLRVRNGRWRCVRVEVECHQNQVTRDRAAGEGQRERLGSTWSCAGGHLQKRESNGRVNGKGQSDRARPCGISRTQCHRRRSRRGGRPRDQTGRSVNRQSRRYTGRPETRGVVVRGDLIRECTADRSARRA